MSAPELEGNLVADLRTFENELVQNLSDHTTEASGDEGLFVPLQIKCSYYDAVVDSGAFSIWLDQDVLIRLGGELQAHEKGAQAVNVVPLCVVGKGSLSFWLWGAVFQHYPVHIMKNKPSKISMGRKFWVNQGLQLCLRSMRGSIRVNQHEYSGPVTS